MRRVLVIAYYFPPMGLSGVQRVSKFVKYLPEFGWTPTVLTAQPRGYFAYDASLMDDVAAGNTSVRRTTSWDPTRLFGKREVVSLPEEGSRRRMAMLSSWLFVPDNKIGWAPAALRGGHRTLRETKHHAVFSSAPPYTAHLIGVRLGRQHGIPVVADFRDDWVGNPRHVYPTRLHRALNLRLEGRILKESAHVFTINEPIRSSLLGRHPTLGDGLVSVLPQGFDADDFRRDPEPRRSERCRFLYCGIFYDAQTPDFFLRALARLVEAEPGLRKRVEAAFVGLVPDSSKRLAERLGVDDLVRYEGYLDHARAVEEEMASDVLWMTVGRRQGAEGISTGKLFEYMGTRKPILALVPEGAAREAVGPYEAARIVDPEDVSAIADAMRELIEQWTSGSLPKPDDDYVRAFDRRVLTQRLAATLDDVAQVR